MRLQELFLIETTEEDRGLISLSSAIADHLKTVDIDSEENAPDYDDEYDPDLDGDRGERDEPIVLGKIGDFFDTPFEVLNNVTLELQSGFGLKVRDGKVNSKPAGSVIKGMWDGNNGTLVLNKDYVGTKSIKSTIAHELRHALDDYKSNGEAFKTGGRYVTPKKKEHRKSTNDPYFGNVAYLAEPAEINARFVQVLHDLVPIIQRSVKLPGANGKASIESGLKKSLEDNRIADLFPEKTKSKSYQRLIKRAYDFINKELAHVQSQKTSSF